MGSIEYAEHLCWISETFPLGICLGDMAHQNIPAHFVLFKFQWNMGAPGSVVQDGDQNTKGIVKQEIPDFLHIIVFVIARSVHGQWVGFNLWLKYRKKVLSLKCPTIKEKAGHPPRFDQFSITIAINFPFPPLPLPG